MSQLINQSIIRCLRCKIPYIKIYSDKQTILKWWGGKFWEVDVAGVSMIKCFKCGEKIDLLKGIDKK